MPGRRQPDEIGIRGEAADLDAGFRLRQLVDVARDRAHGDADRARRRRLVPAQHGAQALGDDRWRVLDVVARREVELFARHAAAQRRQPVHDVARAVHVAHEIAQPDQRRQHDREQQQRFDDGPAQQAHQAAADDRLQRPRVRGVHQHHAVDLGAQQVGVQARQGEHHHAADAVADEGHRRIAGLGDDRAQVLGEALDRVAAVGRLARPAQSRQVPQHEAIRLRQLAAHGIPRVAVQRPAVGQHEHGAVGRTVEFDVEPAAVRRVQHLAGSGMRRGRIVRAARIEREDDHAAEQGPGDGGDAGPEPGRGDECAREPAPDHPDAAGQQGQRRDAGDCAQQER